MNFKGWPWKGGRGLTNNQRGRCRGIVREGGGIKRGNEDRCNGYLGIGIVKKKRGEEKTWSRVFNTRLRGPFKQAYTAWDSDVVKGIKKTPTSVPKEKQNSIGIKHK